MDYVKHTFELIEHNYIDREDSEECIQLRMYLLHAVGPHQLRFARLSQSVDLTDYLYTNIFQMGALSLQPFQPTYDHAVVIRKKPHSSSI